VKILENLFLKNLSFSKNSRKIWSGVLTPSGEVDFNLNRGGIRQGVLQGGHPTG